MGKLEKYSSYTDSGVEWLGEIPEHWEVQKMKYITKFISGFPFNSQKFDPCDGINVVRIGDIKDTIDLSKCMKSLENKIHRNTIIKRNDTLIALSGATTGKSCFIYVDIEETYINQRIAKFNYSNSFLYYCISNEKFKKDILLGADGSAQENVSNTTIENMFIPFPSDIEQIKIASFLDEKTAQIDDVISQKQKLIELLKERKQIVINDAVTKGLDKNVEFVDSGVEWIGEIPKHWEVFPGLRVFSENKRKNAGMIDDRVLSLSYGRIIRKPKEKLVGLVPESFETYQIVKAGDIIIRCTDLQNDKVSLRTALAKDDGIITSAYLNLNVKNGSSEYWHYLLHVLDITKAIYKLGSGLRQNLSFNDFKRLDIVLPPKNEQIKIVEYIETQTSKIDKAIELQQNYISKLKEYKVSLIDSVVTGKVKVA